MLCHMNGVAAGRHMKKMSKATRRITERYFYNIFINKSTYPPRRSQDSAVGISTGRPRSCSSSPGRVKNFLFSTPSRPALGPTQSPIQWVSWALSPGVKQPGREADHSPPTSTEIKKMWLYTSTPRTPSWRSA
jgi:hypothetical protein